MFGPRAPIGQVVLFTRAIAIVAKSGECSRTNRGKHMQTAKLAVLTAGVLISLSTGATQASARGVVVDDGLNPNLLRFGLETLTGSSCDMVRCKVALPYSVDFGGGFTNKLYLYKSGVISIGTPLPSAAFASVPTAEDGSPITIPDYFAASGFRVLAPGYRPDDAGQPGSLVGVGQVTRSSIQQFASASIGFCTPGNSNPSFTTCPDGFDPLDPDANPNDFIDPFIAINGLDRFEGNINLRVGLQYAVLHKPSSGFVDVEFFQDDNFLEETDPVYVGLGNQLEFLELDDAKARDFTYRFAVQTGVPEPQSWAAMLLGFAVAGGAFRTKRRARHAW